jgi:hypothetical protein
MAKVIIQGLFFVVGLLLVVACGSPEPKMERAFYYWKNAESSISWEEETILRQTTVNKLYIKFFEVATDPLFVAVPVAKTNFRINYYRYKNDSLLGNINVIPTVFVRNDVLKNIKEPALDTLADNIVFLVTKYYKERCSPKKDTTLMEGIQIDCDWTASTKENYFYLLRKIKTHFKGKISCTLRLYPYKYRQKMGVPPVDRAMLMCYNLISPLGNETKNSILDNGELEAYLKDVNSYPLPLDLALPVFHWVQFYQNGKFVGLLKQTPEWFTEEYLTATRPMWYSVKKDVVVGDQFLRVGDELKVEFLSDKELMEAIALLKKYVTFKGTYTIALFHLDDENLKKYKYETLNTLFNSFLPAEK